MVDDPFNDSLSRGVKLRCLLRASLLLTFVALLPISSSAIVPDAPPSTEKMMQGCTKWCERLFGDGSEQRSECDAGCSVGEACEKKCRLRFPESKEKREGCFKVCTR